MSERHFMEPNSVIEILEGRAEYFEKLAEAEEGDAEAQECHAKRMREDAYRHRVLANECRNAVAALSNVEGR